MRRNCVMAVLSAMLTIATGVSGAGATDGTVPYDFSGGGSTRTTVFRLPDRWSLKWSFDCSGSIAGPGIFSVQVVELDASSVPRLNLRIPRLLRFDGVASGVERYEQGGHRAFLRIASQCPWTIRVAGFGS